jgi:protein TonB
LDEVIGGGTSMTIGPIPQPRPLPAPPAPKQEPLPVGGKIKHPIKLVDVKPIYPPIAQTARVQGLVIIAATIGPSGDVVDARVLRSVPLLDDAALTAVRQWKFSPTLLNGVPVAVVMTVTVNFTLQ